jgi:hypothetical protein
MAGGQRGGAAAGGARPGLPPNPRTLRAQGGGAKAQPKQQQPQQKGQGKQQQQQQQKQQGGSGPNRSVSGKAWREGRAEGVAKVQRGRGARAAQAERECNAGTA